MTQRSPGEVPEEKPEEESEKEPEVESEVEPEAGISARQFSAENPQDNLITTNLAERRIAWLTLIFGAVAAAILALRHQRDWAAGIAIGAGLAWINFRWLRRGLDALAGSAAAQSGAAKPRVPLWVWALLLLRYGLIGMAVYVIFAYLHVPIASMVVGLCALGAATIAASVYEIVHPAK